MFKGSFIYSQHEVLLTRTNSIFNGMFTLREIVDLFLVFSSTLNLLEKLENYYIL